VYRNALFRSTEYSVYSFRDYVVTMCTSFGCQVQYMYLATVYVCRKHALYHMLLYVIVCYCMYVIVLYIIVLYKL